MLKFFAPLVLLIVVIMGFFYYIKPGYAGIQEKGQDIRQYDAALAKAKEFADKRDELVIEMNGYDATDLDRLKRIVPENIDTTRLVLEIDEIAKRHSSGIASVRVSEQKQTGAEAEARAAQPWGSIAVGFSIQATYTEFQAFLTDLEDNLRLNDISILAFSPSADASTKYTFDVNLSTYWLRPVK